MFTFHVDVHFDVHEHVQFMYLDVLKKVDVVVHEHVQVHVLRCT
jgi:hypothetical protein